MNNVVARFADGRIVKGVSMNVDITKPACHVRTSDGKMEEVRLADLKALFFVKSLDGDSAHNEAMAAEASLVFVPAALAVAFCIAATVAFCIATAYLLLGLSQRT